MFLKFILTYVYEFSLKNGPIINNLLGFVRFMRSSLIPFPEIATQYIFEKYGSQ